MHVYRKFFVCVDVALARSRLYQKFNGYVCFFLVMVIRRVVLRGHLLILRRWHYNKNSLILLCPYMCNSGNATWPTCWIHVVLGTLSSMSREQYPPIPSDCGESLKVCCGVFTSALRQAEQSGRSFLNVFRTTCSIIKINTQRLIPSNKEEKWCQD